MADKQEANIKELVEYLTTNIVSDQDDVEVTLVEERDANVYEIEVGDEDLGKIIGRGGKTARAIRSVVSAASPASDKKILIEILE